MPEQLSTDQLELATRARDFAANVLVPTAGADSPASRREVVNAAKEAGFFQMTQPRDFGGTEASPLELTIVREALAAANAPLQGVVFGPSPGVLGQSEEPLRSRYLGPLMAGEKRGGFGFTEPDDAPHPTEGQIDGDFVVVNGQKSYVTGGADADFINTLVQIRSNDKSPDADSGPAIVVIDTDAAGVTMTNRFASLDGSHHAAFKFSNVRMPVSHIIGKPGQGLPRAMRQIGDTRLSIAASCVGTMQYVLELVTTHLLAPDRSGSPRGNKEGVRLRYADLRINAYAARSMLYRTARLATDGANVINEGIACKVFATECVGELVDMAIQLMGGNALIVGHPLEALYRQVRALRLAEGGSDVLRLNLARGRLDLDMGRI